MMAIKEKSRYLTVDYNIIKLTMLDLRFLLLNNKGFIDGDKYMINIEVLK